MESLPPPHQVALDRPRAIAAIVLGGILFGLDQWQFSVPLAAIAGVVAIGLVLGTVYALRLYQLWRFELQDDALYLERGVVTFVETAVPFVRVQHVDTQFGPVERVLGLSSVVVYTAGSRNADVRIPD